MSRPAVPAADTRHACALSPATARIYAGVWAAFRAWCRAQDVVALSAAADTLAAYLEACAVRLGPGGLRRVLAAEWSPWQALLRLRGDWPRLALDLRPDCGGA